jgi:hypothetical protein
LGFALFQQAKYDEAEKYLQNAVEEGERVMGEDNAVVMWTRQHLLGLQGCQQATKAQQELRERILPAVRAQMRRTYAEPGPSTRASSNQADQTIAEAFRPISSTPAIPKNPLSKFFPQEGINRNPYTDSEILQISELLRNINPQWSKVPRTYMVLRLIGRMELLDDFIDIGFTDYWFPASERTIPPIISPTYRSRFIKAQNLVLTKSLDLEKTEKGQHCFFQQGEPLPFERKEVLGSGGFGQVDKVVSLISWREYARKRTPRSVVFGDRKAKFEESLIAEINILKKLRHHHVIEFVGSYTDPEYLGLIMYPVAEMDLAAYLEVATESSASEIRTFFGCLARAVEFLHSRNIRHKDIKPGNILVDNGNVLLTDFGLSLDFADAESDGGTTVSMVNGFTRKYCAPEVVMMEPRNTSSDIWSLGVVFLEMLVVLKGKTVSWMYEFLSVHGSKVKYVNSNINGTKELSKSLGEMGGDHDSEVLVLLNQMLQKEQQSRPTAGWLVSSIITSSGMAGERTRYCGPCCAGLDEVLLTPSIST